MNQHYDPTGSDVWVDSEPVREHVRALMAAGLGWRQVAKAAGIPQSTVGKLLYGSGPRKYAHIMTAKRLLAVTPTMDSYADRSQVDGTITRRKLEALIAIGWSAQKLGNKLGIRRQHVHLMLTRPTVSAQRARLVRSLFEELWNTPPVAVTVEDKRAITNAVWLAEERGYRRPMDWVDIEDPGEQPAEDIDDYIDEVAVRRVIDGGDPSILTRAEKHEAARILVHIKGYKPNTAAQRLHMSYKTVRTAVAA